MVWEVFKRSIVQRLVKLKKWLNQSTISRSSHRRFSVKKVYLEISQNSQQNTCAHSKHFESRPKFLQKNKVSALNSVSTARKCIEKETPTQIFSREFCKNFQNIFSTEYLRTTTSALPQPRLAYLQNLFFGGVLQNSFLKDLTKFTRKKTSAGVSS